MIHAMGRCTFAAQAAISTLCVTHTTHSTWGNLLLKTSLWFRRLRRTTLPESILARLIERLVWQRQPASQAPPAIEISFFPDRTPNDLWCPNPEPARQYGHRLLTLRRFQRHLCIELRRMSGVSTQLALRRRVVLYPSTHFRVSRPNWPTDFQRPRSFITSVLNKQIMLSARALSHESSTLTTEVYVPATPRRSL